MILIAIIIGCVIGAIIGIFMPIIPYTYSGYLAIAIIAALDSVFGGIVATLNKNLDIQSQKLTIIPTEWKTELLCYEFKGKIDETEFLVYINAKNGREENILVIIETPGGILAM